MYGDTNPVRQIGNYTMYDSLAILEDPTSEEFLKTVAKENNNWRKSLKPHKLQVNKWESEFKKTYAEAIPAKPEFANETINDNIKIQYSSGHRLNVWFLKENKHYLGITGFGIDENSDLFYTIQDVGNGKETLELQVYDGFHELLWAHQPVGPEAIFYNEQILFQTVENQLRYPGIILANKHTGKSQKQIFEEKDKRYQVELIQPYGQLDIFIKKQNALNQRLAIFNNDAFTWLAPKSESVFPIAKDIYATNSEIVVNSNKYPLLPNEFFVDAILVDDTILYTTTHMAKMTLYEFDLKKKQIHKLFEKDTICDIKVRKYSTIPTIEIGFPNKSTRIYNYVNKTLKKIFTFPEPIELEYSHGLARSKDGTNVPYTFVYRKHDNPKKLFIEGYGSYGISSRRTYPIQRLAWLKKGYAVAVAFARGGREDGDRWYDGGRTALRKQNTFDDTAAVIHKIQTEHDISPKKTVFYGRSAGGLLAANIAHQFPHLVQVVYAEVPYLDVLRTTTNPNLPLTQLEYDEFGDPHKRKEDLNAILKFSPVDTVPKAPKHSPLIIVKTALNDSQVLPYETLKWAKKLRENGWNVLVGVDDGGHFVAESKLYTGLSEDAALVDYALSIRAVQASRGATRRNTSSSKHFTRHRTSSFAE